MNKQDIIDGLDVILGRRGEKITQGDILIVEAAIMALANAPQPEAMEFEMPNAIWLAKFFHDTYERLAPQFGYATRPETRQFDHESTNGRLMAAVCEELRQALKG